MTETQNNLAPVCRHKVNNVQHIPSPELATLNISTVFKA